MFLAQSAGGEGPAAQPWHDRSPTAIEDLPAASLTRADRLAIDDVVGRQLRAFRDDEAGTAFGLATARLRRQLGSPARLMNLVRRDYGELYRPRSVSNVDFVKFRGYPTRRLRVVGADGAVVVAYYMMRKDDGGDWRIAGCVLARVPAETS